MLHCEFPANYLLISVAEVETIRAQNATLQAEVRRLGDQLHVAESERKQLMVESQRRAAACDQLTDLLRQAIAVNQEAAEEVVRAQRRSNELADRQRCIIGQLAEMVRGIAADRPSSARKAAPSLREALSHSADATRQALNHPLLIAPPPLDLSRFTTAAALLAPNGVASIDIDGGDDILPHASWHPRTAESSEGHRAEIARPDPSRVPFLPGCHSPGLAAAGSKSVATPPAAGAVATASPTSAPQTFRPYTIEDLLSIVAKCPPYNGIALKGDVHSAWVGLGAADRTRRDEVLAEALRSGALVEEPVPEKNHAAGLRRGRHPTNFYGAAVYSVDHLLSVVARCSHYHGVALKASVGILWVEDGATDKTRRDDTLARALSSGALTTAVVPEKNNAAGLRLVQAAGRVPNGAAPATAAVAERPQPPKDTGPYTVDTLVRIVGHCPHYSGVALMADVGTAWTSLGANDKLRREQVLAEALRSGAVLKTAVREKKSASGLQLAARSAGASSGQHNAGDSDREYTIDRLLAVVAKCNLYDGVALKGDVLNRWSGVGASDKAKRDAVLSEALRAGVLKTKEVPEKNYAAGLQLVARAARTAHTPAETPRLLSHSAPSHVPTDALTPIVVSVVEALAMPRNDSTLEAPEGTNGGADRRVTTSVAHQTTSAAYVVQQPAPVPALAVEHVAEPDNLAAEVRQSYAVGHLLAVVARCSQTGTPTLKTTVIDEWIAQGATDKAKRDAAIREAVRAGTLKEAPVPEKKSAAGLLLVPSPQVLARTDAPTPRGATSTSIPRPASSDFAPKLATERQPYAIETLVSAFGKCPRYGELALKSEVVSEWVDLGATDKAMREEVLRSAARAGTLIEVPVAEKKNAAGLQLVVPGGSKSPVTRQLPEAETASPNEDINEPYSVECLLSAVTQCALRDGAARKGEVMHRWCVLGATEKSRRAAVLVYVLRSGLLKEKRLSAMDGGVGLQLVTPPTASNHPAPQALQQAAGPRPPVPSPPRCNQCLAAVSVASLQRPAEFEEGHSGRPCTFCRQGCGRHYCSPECEEEDWTAGIECSAAASDVGERCLDSDK